MTPTEEPSADNERAYRIGSLAALGVLLSGPLAVVLVNASHPQPPWRDAEAFAHSYHPIQLLPLVPDGS